MADDLQAAEEAVTRAETELAKAEGLIAEAKKAADAARLARDEAIVARDGPKRPHQGMEDRLAYIRKQQEVRAARFGKAAVLAEKMGGSVAELNAQAPIDAAMSRKTKRGTQRPGAKKDDDK